MTSTAGTTSGGRFACDGADGGPFGPSILVSTNYMWTTFTVGDLDGDGNLDIAAMGGQSVAVLLGNGDASFRPAVLFSPPISTNFYPQALSVVKVGSPTAQLLAVSCEYYMSMFSGLLLGKVDDSGVLTIVATPDGLEAFDARAANLTRDGLTDLMAVAYSAWGRGTADAVIEAFLANGGGGWNPGVVAVPAPDSEPQGDFIGDFNDDGVPDILEIAFAKNQVVVYPGHGDGTFSDAGIFTSLPANGVQSVHVGDLNEDGHLDLLAIGRGDGPSFTLLGRGDGTFSRGPDVGLDGGIISSPLQDLNGDGHLDYISSDWDIFIGFGNGDGSFKPEIRLAMPDDGGFGYTIVEVGDVNNDGRPDLIATPNFSSGSFTIFLNQCR
jgi:hypothetical protein